MNWILAGAIKVLSEIASWLIEEAVKVFQACFREPRAFILIGVALAVGHWIGFDNGYGQGKGDLDTYRASAEAMAQVADKNAEEAIAVGKRAAELEAARTPEPPTEETVVKCADPITVEKPKRRIKPVVQDKPGPLDWITGSIK